MLYTMGEVAEMFDVTPSLIRHWESQFKQLKPTRNNKGNRLFTPSDIETLKVIYHLVRERGMTLEGANKAMNANKKIGKVVQGSIFNDGEPTTTIYERDAQIVERLHKLRASLEELRAAIDHQSGTAQPQPMTRRRRESSDEQPSSGELFAFYEQRLF